MNITTFDECSQISGQVGGLYGAVVHRLRGVVEAENLLGDVRRAAGLHLVLVAEDVETRQTAAVIENALRQHAQQGALARVDVTHHRDAHFVEDAVLLQPAGDG